MMTAVPFHQFESKAVDLDNFDSYQSAEDSSNL